MDDTTQSGGFPNSPSQPQMAYPPVYAPAPRGSGIFMRFVAFFLLLLLMGSVAMNFMLLMILGLTNADRETRIEEKYYSHNREATEKVAIFSIEGTILSGEGFFKRQIDHARKDIKDGKLKAIVVRVNSPGGTISGSDYMLYHLRKLAEETEIPMVVSMGPVAASGGYYVSMCVGDQPDTIFAEPSTWTGSIGVVIPHFNVAELMKKWGVEDDDVASGPLKTMGSISRKMKPEEREIFQKLVDEGFTQFKNVIKKGRPKFEQDPAALDKLATGQVYTAEQALANGLIDKIGYVEDAIDRVIELGGLNKDNIKVVKYEAEPQLSEILFGKSPVSGSYDLAALLDMTAPRAYYLCTWLPAIAGTAE